MNPYLKMDVETASPARKVIMLYEKAILCMEDAKLAIEENDLKTKVESILRAHDIIRVLNASLDMEKGGEIAENLRALYEFIEDSLVKVNASNDVKLLDDLIEIVANLKSAWEEIESKI
ncbi:flagellar export chaperone FliS [Desulfurobacterium atlanticum]|uniref:Flagellar protein FliS n=1 Tax=Desulfurobacterium atlanticum TaxID=240169 RepID=A0A238ZEM1_9BACT|nr:flagellar export chaperone FliS [Desulfurobacterium atlanticum]SNR81966.1 flagellar protein FliS [Desulfurobacterium atlanticum]